MNPNTDSHYFPQPIQQVPPNHRLTLPPLPPTTDYLTEGFCQKKKQRTKRTAKLVPVGGSSSSTGGATGGVVKRKYAKPDPGAPKISRPCSECGKKFWSWKALFGHMRCHPERQWRGINPPSDVIRQETVVEVATSSGHCGVEMTEEDHEVAACLLSLANGGHEAEFGSELALMESALVVRDMRDVDGGGSNFQFKCSGCKKVFGSHQALGGHRASHKNVKGCFAHTKVEGDDEHRTLGRDGECVGAGCSVELPLANSATSSTMAVALRHSCNICSKVFSSGQAIGGHMRCHWEKGEDPPIAPLTPRGVSNPLATHGLDLNRPAPMEHDASSSCSSRLRLDLRLGL